MVSVRAMTAEAPAMTAMTSFSPTAEASAVPPVFRPTELRPAVVSRGEKWHWYPVRCLRLVRGSTTKPPSLGESEPLVLSIHQISPVALDRNRSKEGLTAQISTEPTGGFLCPHMSKTLHGSGVSTLFVKDNESSNIIQNRL